MGPEIEAGEARPLLALTMGDPAGIGPELVLAALASDEMKREARMLVVGDPELLSERAKRTGIDAGRYVAELIKGDLESREDLDRPWFKVGQLVRVTVGTSTHYGQIQALGTRSVKVRLTEASHERLESFSPGHPVEAWWNDKAVEVI